MTIDGLYNTPLYRIYVTHVTVFLYMFHYNIPMKTLIILLIGSLLFSAEVSLEILGSGGPEIDGRASSSYLIRINGKAKILVDAGSGSMLRFEQSGAKLENLEAILLTHLHIDHAVDLPAYIKAGYFSNRTAPLTVVGPAGNSRFPSITEYLYLLFGPRGAYRYMQDILTAQSDSFQIIPREITGTGVIPIKFTSFSVDGISVHHGIVPALAFRITVANKTVVISGDTNNRGHGLEKLAKDADLFIAHHAIAQHSGSYAKELHMTPDAIGKIAGKANVRKVILSHRMKRTLENEKESLKIVRRNYHGDVVFAEDRMKLTF